MYLAFNWSFLPKGCVGLQKYRYIESRINNGVGLTRYTANVSVGIWVFMKIRKEKPGVKTEEGKND